MEAIEMKNFVYKIMDDNNISYPYGHKIICETYIINEMIPIDEYNDNGNCTIYVTYKNEAFKIAVKENYRLKDTLTYYEKLFKIDGGKIDNWSYYRSSSLDDTIELWNNKVKKLSNIDKLMKNI